MSFIWGLFDFLIKGGWVACVLAFLSAVLWYAIGYRFFFLKSSYLKSDFDKLLDHQEIDEEDLLGPSIRNIQMIVTREIKDIELALELEQKKITNLLKTHRQTITSIVVVAPLLGLLGTVIGMIETFESLQDSALFSQSGGIAGGISQALITTQMGLVVAIPGLLIGRKLDRKEEEVSSLLERLGQYILVKRGSHEV